MDRDCTCEWKYLWHSFNREHEGMQERTPAIVRHATDCPVPEHAALAALLPPQAPKRKRDPHAAATERYIERLESKVSAEGSYGAGVAEAYNALHSTVPSERARGRDAAAKVLGDLR